MTENRYQALARRARSRRLPSRAARCAMPAEAAQHARMAWLAAGLVALAIAFSVIGTGTAAAQLSPGTGINDNSAFRERSRQQMESYQDRLRYGHDIGRERALDTAERARRDRMRQLDRQDQIRRQRSQ